MARVGASFYPCGRIAPRFVSTTKHVHVVNTFIGASGIRTLFNIKLTQGQARVGSPEVAVVEAKAIEETFRKTRLTHVQMPEMPLWK